MSDLKMPQVNAGVTDRNREQTKRICELRGWKYEGKYYENIDTYECVAIVPGGLRHPLIRGSLTLCQVVGMLEREHVYFERHHQGQSSSTVEGWYFAQWGEPGKADREMLLMKTANPHDLTAAMDALIKVLEEKG